MPNSAHYQRPTGLMQKAISSCFNTYTCTSLWSCFTGEW